MLDDFLTRALIAGAGIAVVAGPLGCFVVWRRMAYFGDSLAHSALLGVALGLLLGLSNNVGTMVTCGLFALLLLSLQQTKLLATDTLLGILAHAALSIGMVVLSFVENRQFDLHAYLFGDILTVTLTDIYWIYGGGILVVAFLLFNWVSLTLMTLHEDLARAEGVKTFWVNLILVMLMTIVVAVSIRIVGILLITSLLIIPAATSRQLVRSPEMMAVFASLIGLVSVMAGIIGSASFDTPTGPSIVTSATAIFIIIAPVAVLIRQVKQRRRDLFT
ncbi:metal ABC transporter permease [Sneathiella limimaris]|uniref:metal ABC transporter permease n=1 Tax=Sneathiella limimaris TaxID=1964213 RepID=UPI0019D2E0BA|nr:iron chelate uptake ABC transporter family permease subunit [Sneathiella limimaris]